jgi:group I intron endonuclease
MNIGIYKITCTGNNKCYIGQSSDLICRKKRHFSDLKLNKHFSKFLQHSYNKYGKESILFEIIELCEKSHLNKQEIFWIEHYNSFHDGFNSTLGGRLSIVEPKKFDFLNLSRGIEINCSIPELVERYSEDKLDKGYLYKVTGRKKFSYKGWSCKCSNFKIQKKAGRGNPISMTNTISGETIVFENITRAAEYINSDISAIVKIKKGKMTQTKGWTISGLNKKRKFYLKPIELENVKTGEIKTFESHGLACLFLNRAPSSLFILKKRGGTCNGWKIPDAKISNKTKKSIYLKSPDGKIYFFESGMHFSRFIGVRRDSIKALMTGKKDFYKKWKRVNESELQGALVEFPDP